MRYAAAGRARYRGAAGLGTAPAPTSSARSPQTLSGKELQLHASALLLFSFDLTVGTAVPSRAGRDLRVFTLMPGNGTARSVGPTSTRSLRPFPPALRVRAAERPLPLCSPPQETTAINDSAVVEWDIAAANGVIHALAEPLRLPPPAVQLEQASGGGTERSAPAPPPARRDAPLPRRWAEGRALPALPRGLWRRCAWRWRGRPPRAPRTA